MSVQFYVPKENGDLKFVDEVEGTSDVEAALEALLDARPKLQHDAYVFVSVEGESLNGDGGVIGIAEVTEEEEVVTRRKVRVGGGDEPAPKKRGRPRKQPVEEVEEDEEEAAPPKRRGRPPGSKNKATAASAAPKRRGRPPGSGKKKTPFTRNEASDE
jgi:hypothetical protein